jgi:hypothetical protein
VERFAFFDENLVVAFTPAEVSLVSCAPGMFGLSQEHESFSLLWTRIQVISSKADMCSRTFQL